MDETIVMSLGGSLISPKKVSFLKKFKKLILSQVKKEKKIIIVTGGGSNARTYQDAAKIAGSPNKKDLDLIGIEVTRLNALLIWTLFKRDCKTKIIDNPKSINLNNNIIIVSGWKPGFSTDNVATNIAKRLQLDQIINLTNTDYIYTKDPNKYKDAKKITTIRWDSYLKMISKTWQPGLKTPFDPVASKACKKSKITVVVANGNNIENIKNILENKKFIGTTITS